MNKIKIILASLTLLIGFLVLAGRTYEVNAEGTSTAQNDGKAEDNYTGLKTVEYDDTFDLYYYVAGKPVVNKWVTVKEKKGKFRYYFGKDGKAYKAASIKGMRTTKVQIRTVKGKKYGFDENGHRVKGLWSTGEKLAFFSKKNGVYNKKVTKKYQKVVKYGKTSPDMIKTIKKVFGKPKKIKETNSCNPFDITDGSGFSGDTLKKYKGYTCTYKNIVISLTKNVETGVYHMEGASPLDVEISAKSKGNAYGAEAVKAGLMEDNGVLHYYENGVLVKDKCAIKISVDGRDQYCKIDAEGNVIQWRSAQALAAKQLIKLKAVPANTSNKKSVEKCLKKAFKWSAKIKYVNISKKVKKDSKALEYYGTYGFTNLKGDCNVQAATFTLMAQVLGYDATFVRGLVPQALKNGKPANFGNHAWVTIKQGKKKYVYDPNFERTHKAGWKFRYGAKKHYRYFSKKKKELKK